MSTFMWPSTLPDILLNTFSLKVTDVKIRSESDSGYIRQRRQFTSALNTFKGSFRLNKRQLKTFAIFYKYIIHEGAEWFIMKIDTEEGISNKQVRFSGAYVIKKISDNIYDLSASFEIFPYNIGNQTDIDHIINDRGIVDIEAANALQRAVEGLYDIDKLRI